jgi:hypothetical protein
MIQASQGVDERFWNTETMMGEQVQGLNVLPKKPHGQVYLQPSISLIS